jgi:hypothetical protein
MAADVHMSAAEAAAGSPEAFTTSDGVRIVFERHGAAAAPVVVLIHGWSGSRQYFVRNIPQLAREVHVSGCCPSSSPVALQLGCPLPLLCVASVQQLGSPCAATT